VTIEFADGEIKEVVLPDSSQGFYRESYTWKDRVGYTWKERVNCYEILWTVIEPKDQKEVTEEPLLLESV